jgi:hypothetical protein
MHLRQEMFAFDLPTLHLSSAGVLSIATAAF